MSERLVYRVLNNEIWKDPDYVPCWKPKQQAAAQTEVIKALTAAKNASYKREELVKSACNPENASIHTIDDNSAFPKGYGAFL